MKTKFKIFGIITVIMLIMCLMVGCDDPSDDDDDNPGGGGGGGGGSGSSSLSAPTGVAAEGRSSSSINITWNAVTGGLHPIKYTQLSNF